MNTSTNPLSRLFGGIAQALSHRVYRIYWFGTAASIIGRWMLRMVIGWLTWELTESTAWLGIIAFAETFPLVIFSLLGGAVADKSGYLRMMRVSQFFIGCFTVLFALLVWIDFITIEVVLVLTIILGSLEALNSPSRLSIVNALVPKKDLSAAIALGSATFNLGRILGTSIGGALIVFVNNESVIALAAVTFFLFFALLLRTRIDESQRGSLGSLNLIKDMKESIVYIWNHEGIFYLR